LQHLELWIKKLERAIRYLKWLASSPALLNFLKSLDMEFFRKERLRKNQGGLRYSLAEGNDGTKISKADYSIP